MTISHHLDDATLVSYASGELDEAFCIVVAAHLALCETCRHAVRVAEEIGGQCLEEGDVAELSPFAFNRLMQQLDDGPEQFVARPAERGGVVDRGDVPLPLRRHLGSSLSDISWQRVAPGVRKHVVKLSASATSSLFLLNIAAGKKLPEHGHGGSEMTLVLSGAYRDSMGRFGRGDIADLDEHIEHQPRVEPNDACICIVATEAPTRFKGLFSRMLQPLAGI